MAKRERWHHLTHRTTGERQIVASLDGIDRDVWDAKRLPREPGVHDEVEGSKIVHCPEKEARAERRARYQAMDKADLIGWLEALEERVAALEAARIVRVDPVD